MASNICQALSAGFDARLGMSIPDLWVKMLRASREGGVRDEAWSMHEIVATLCNRRYTVRRCRLIVSNPAMKAPMVSALETII